MLILTRKAGEAIMIGDDIQIAIIEITKPDKTSSGQIKAEPIKTAQVRVGIKAPKEVTVHRHEVYQVIRDEETERTEDDK